ncbi:MAG TPA: pyridoxine 5'-phosphate synthase [Fibrobacteria bacterium]|nr:pyridoxine 5'-phosphate synthase [Fibrobacteria bacterium]
MVKLGLNIDHVATVREARKERNPDPVAAAAVAELAGVHGITVHLREDLRHIQERDVRLLRQTVSTRLNLEMSPTQAMVQFALELQPDMVTLVPERRQELTTEGGLDVAGHERELEKIVQNLRAQRIRTSLFVDPEARQVRAAQKVSADAVELHTGNFSRAFHEGESDATYQAERSRLVDSVGLGTRLGLRVNAGHGLDYQNVSRVSSIPGLDELNIGHAIISRAILVGLDRAVRDMIDQIRLGESEAGRK